MANHNAQHGRPRLSIEIYGADSDDGTFNVVELHYFGGRLIHRATSAVGTIEEFEDLVDARETAYETLEIEFTADFIPYSDYQRLAALPLAIS